jgi:hypothetical protein
MPSVSLAEAWNESDMLPPPPPAPPDPARAIAARTVTVPQADDEHGGKAEGGAAPVGREEIELAIGQIALVQSELHELRREQARRCTIHMIMVGILFAILIVYIDRLQNQVRILNSFMIHRQIPTLVSLNRP